MKKLIVSLFALSLAASAFANANQKALEFYTFEIPSVAKRLFTQNLTSGTAAEQAEACFYLGEIAYSEKDIEAAAEFYKKGLSLDPTNLLNAIGEAKLMLKVNKLSAEKMFKAVLSGKNKKNLDLNAAAAKACLDAGELYDANQKLIAAKKVNPKYGTFYQLEGDIYAVKKDISKATELYDQAIYFDANNARAYLKYAAVFTYSNPNAAVNKLKEYASLNPASGLIYRSIGEVYFNNRRYADAVKAYDTYRAKETEAADDYQYALLLFLNNNFDKSMEIVQSGLKTDPNNLDLRRILLYNYYQQGNYADGATYGDSFMSDGKIASRIIALDHLYYARLLAETKRYNDAVAQYEMTLKKDSTQFEVYKELGSMYMATKQFSAAVSAFQSYIGKANNQTKPSDFNALGNAALYTAQYDSLVKADTIRRTAYCLTSDSAFAVVAERVPDSYLGNLGRARINQVLYPETGLGKSKPYFEAIIPLLKVEDAAEAKILIDCYDYLGSYAFVTKDMATAKTYMENILAIDPNHEKAQRVLKQIK